MIDELSLDSFFSYFITFHENLSISFVSKVAILIKN